MDEQRIEWIEIESLVFKGTYDEYQANILKHRRDSMNAQLFGALLDEETLARAALSIEYKVKLAEAAPDWSPDKELRRGVAQMADPAERNADAAAI